MHAKLGSVQVNNPKRTQTGGFSAAQVEAHLERILASEAFKTSRRSQDFLRFVVGRVLAGQGDSIKERTIAVEAFGRPADYDSSEDSYVRVKASEVRRRLASYGESRSEADTLRIELPLGSYVPQFEPVEDAPPEGGEAERVRRRRWALAAGLLAAGVAVWLGVRTPNADPMRRFWAPVLTSRQPLVIFIPTPASWLVVNEATAARAPGGARVIAGETSPGRYVIPGVDKVGLGAAIGAIRFAALCAESGKPYVVKVGGDFSFADLRNQPSVLFGAFSSKWTVEMNNGFRFRFQQEPGPARIVDGRQPGREWLPVPGDAPGRPSEDYAIAGRVFDSKSGQLLLIAAGISTFGTQAAAEFLTDGHRIEELARRAPQPLDRGNFQVLLHTRVMGNTPGPPKIVDAHFW